MMKEPNAKGKAYIGGPTDPEQGKAAAGVGALFLQGLAAYEVQNPTDDYRDAERSGRCKIVCFDAGGTTIICAITYGWTGAKKGNDLAARTDNILAIVEVQFDGMGPGPKIIMGDLNGNLVAFRQLWLSSKSTGGPASAMMKANAMVHPEGPHVRPIRMRAKAE